MKLVDLGIAFLADATTQLTATGSSLGTVGYIAPEVLEGEHAGPSADVWGWACCVVFAVTGQAVYRGTSRGATIAATLADRRNDSALTKLTQMDAALAAVVERALRPDPGDRPADGAALVLSLEALDTRAARRAQRRAP